MGLRQPVRVLHIILLNNSVDLILIIKQVCLDLEEQHQKMQAFYMNEKSALGFEVPLALNNLLMDPTFYQ